MLRADLLQDDVTVQYTFDVITRIPTENIDIIFFHNLMAELLNLNCRRSLSLFPEYLHALSGGEVPLVLLFSGTVFTRGETGFAVEQLSWSLEARCRLPVASWRDLMDLYFPGAGWIRLDRDTIDALARYRSAHGLTSWEQTLATLLPAEVSTP